MPPYDRRPAAGPRIPNPQTEVRFLPIVFAPHLPMAGTHAASVRTRVRFPVRGPRRFMSGMLKRMGAALLTRRLAVRIRLPMPVLSSIFHIGMVPAGRAPRFERGDRWFESTSRCQYILPRRRRIVVSSLSRRGQRRRRVRWGRRLMRLPQKKAVGSNPAVSTSRPSCAGDAGLTEPTTVPQPCPSGQDLAYRLRLINGRNRKGRMLVRIQPRGFREFHAVVAQMAERLFRKQQAAGPIQADSIFSAFRFHPCLADWRGGSLPS